MNIEIDKMSLSDLIEIKDILLTDFDDFWNYNILEQEIKSANSHYLVAKKGKEIVGFAGIKVVLENADIMNIVVKQNYRNQGIGSSLLEKILSLSKNLNISHICLEVSQDNLYAINLYKKFGFTEIGFRKNYYINNSTKKNGIIMSLNLS